MDCVVHVACVCLLTYNTCCNGIYTAALDRDVSSVGEGFVGDGEVCDCVVSRELDHAMLRRLEKRILVGLPTTEARHVMFEHHLPPLICTSDCNGFELTSQLDYQALAQVTHALHSVSLSVCLSHHLSCFSIIYCRSFCTSDCNGFELTSQLDCDTLAHFTTPGLF